MSDRISNNRSNKKTPVNELSALIKNHKFVDVWKTKNPNKSQFTWRRKNGIERSRIDFWLLEENASPLIYSSDIRPVQIKYTDHLGISLKIKLASKRGPNYWKFNNSLLQDQNYLTCITNLINNLNKNKNNDYSHQTLWELYKYEIKERTILFSKDLARQRKNKLNQLEIRLSRLYELNDKTPTDSLKNEIKSVEQEIQLEYTRTAVGAQIRARVQVLDEGETNLKYFAGLEKARQTRKVMNSLVIEDKRIFEIKDILNEEVKFYKTLYTSDTINDDDINDYLSNLEIENKLNNDLSKSCDGLFTIDECKIALFEMKANKSPGSDGFTAEFYQMFWPQLNNVLLDALNNAYTKGELSGAQKHSVLSLLFKQEGP